MQNAELPGASADYNQELAIPELRCDYNAIAKLK
jgi:hypothetical protein